MSVNRPISVASVVPAKDESATVDDVVETARSSPLVDEVLVVVPPGDDATAAAAKDAGATVVISEGYGKGQAMATGVRATEAPIIVFLDGDLIGLRPDHVDELVAPVLEGRAGMTCGLFDRGAALNRIFLHVLPILTGERALHRDLFEALEPEDVAGYKVEAALNAIAAERNVLTLAFVCDGMWHRTKEEKYATPVEGFARKVGMLTTAVWSYARISFRRRVIRRLRRS